MILEKGDYVYNWCYICQKQRKRGEKGGKTVDTGRNTVEGLKRVDQNLQKPAEINAIGS